MLKICAVALALLGLGILIFPQFRLFLLLFVPFAPLAICLAMCPLMMFFMRNTSKDSSNHKEDSKQTKI